MLGNVRPLPHRLSLQVIIRNCRRWIQKTEQKHHQRQVDQRFMQPVIVANIILGTGQLINQCCICTKRPNN